MPAPHGDPREAGFTLIEVLVAFVISAIMLGMIFAAVRVAGDRNRTVLEQARATALARSHVEMFVADPYIEGSSTGVEAGLQWSARESAAMVDPRGLTVLARFNFEVRNSKGQRLIAIERRKLKVAVQP